MVSPLIALVASVSWAAECPEPSDVVTEAHAAVLEARFEDAGMELLRFEGSLACAPRVSAETLARAWLVRGALSSFLGEEAVTVRAFSGAGRVAPGVWNTDYGEPLRETYDAAQGAGSVGEATLATSYEIPAEYAWVDGAPLGLPAQVVPGLHSVQVHDVAGNVVFGRVYDVQKDQIVELAVPVVDYPKPEPERRFGLSARDDSAMLVRAGVSLGVGIALAAVAASQPGVQTEADSLGKLNTSRGVQVGTGLGAYGAFAAAGTFGVLQLVPESSGEQADGSTEAGGQD